MTAEEAIKFIAENKVVIQWPDVPSEEDPDNNVSVLFDGRWYYQSLDQFSNPVAALLQVLEDAKDGDEEEAEDEDEEEGEEADDDPDWTIKGRKE